MRRISLWAAGLILLASYSGPAQQKRTLREVDAEGLEKAVADLKGKVVFVNFWATWCAPCIAEFPDVVKLHQKYHARGLEVIAVSFDMDAPTAIPFLDKQKADFINLLKKPDDDDFGRFDKEWAGALPVSWLFDRTGKRVFFKMAKFDPAALDAQIAALLGLGR
jgi:thiol-disulfide isomerase/thioredoxin